MIQKGKLKLYTDEEARDRLFGACGTPEREEFEEGLAAVLLGSQVGDMVRTIRKERNMTQREFSELLGTQSSQVSKMEKGWPALFTPSSYCTATYAFRNGEGMNDAGLA